MKKKQAGAGGVATPLGAGSDHGHDNPGFDAKKAEQVLREMAKTMPKDRRKEFIAQGKKVIEKKTVVEAFSNKFDAVTNEIADVMKKHGIEAGCMILRLPVTAKEKETSINGWGVSVRCPQAYDLELTAMLFKQAHHMSGKSGKLNI